jgi:hypothetical protein
MANSLFISLLQGSCDGRRGSIGCENERSGENGVGEHRRSGQGSLEGLIALVLGGCPLEGYIRAEQKQEWFGQVREVRHMRTVVAAHGQEALDLSRRRGDRKVANGLQVSRVRSHSISRDDVAEKEN